MQAKPGKWAQSRSKLILILSSERSGSTLLRVMLGEHSRIIAPSELWLMYYPDYATWRRERPLAMESLVEYFDLIGQPRTISEIDATCQDLNTQDVYRWMLNHLDSGFYLADKTPAYANDITIMLRSQEFAPHYIWLIRHPLGVIDSHVRMVQRRRNLMGTKALGRRILYWIDKSIDWSARRCEVKWVRQNANIRAFLSSVSDSQKHVVYFEDLVTTPKATLDGLCEAIGLALESAMLSVCPKEHMIKLGIGDPTFHKRDQIDPETAYRWREQFSEHRLRVETRNLMRETGVKAVLDGSL